MPSSYDDSRLRRFYAELAPRERRRALRGAFRRCGAMVRKVAQANLRATGLSHADRMGRALRTVVFRRVAGFRVSAAWRKASRSGKGERGMHVNRYGLSKPVLAWAETGTDVRRVKRKGSGRFLIGGRWRRAGRERGRMKRYGYLAKTERQVEGQVTERLRQEVVSHVEKLAKKHGCS